MKNILKCDNNIVVIMNYEREKMERIALISDLHSNIVATKSVFKDIEERGIKKNLLFRRFSS